MLTHGWKDAERETGPKKEQGLHYKAQCDRATSQIPTRHHYKLKKGSKDRSETTLIQHSLNEALKQEERVEG